MAPRAIETAIIAITAKGAVAPQLASGALILAASTVTCSPLAKTVECRASTGLCDPAELCDGASMACPADALAASGEVCRGTCAVGEGASAGGPSVAVLLLLLLRRRRRWHGHGQGQR